jgi:hypothetical protein
MPRETMRATVNFSSSLGNFSWTNRVLRSLDNSKVLFGLTRNEGALVIAQP